MMGLLSHTTINTNKDGAPELVILPLQSEVKAIFQNTPYSMPSAPSHQPSTENPTGNKEVPSAASGLSLITFVRKVMNKKIQQILKILSNMKSLFQF